MKDTHGKFTDFGLLWLRVLMGAGIAYHGYQKLAHNSMPKLIEGVSKMGFPLPEFFAWAALGAELGGGLLLALGIFPRISAFFIFVTMSVAAFITHKSDPLQVKELALAYWTIAGALMLTGGGKFSLGRVWSKG